MAPRKNAGKNAGKAREPIDQDDEPLDDVVLTPADRAERIAVAIAAELSDRPDGITWTLKVYRVLGAANKGVKQPWLFDCDPEELPTLHQRLRDDYGGGDFRVREVKNGEVSRLFDLSVEAPRQVAAPAAPAGAESEITRALAALSARLDAMAGAGAQDPWENLDSMTTIIARLQPQPSTRAESTELMDALFRGIELQKKFTAGEAPSLVSEIATVLQVPAVAGFLENASAAMATRAGKPPAPTPARNDTAPAPAPANSNEALIKSTAYLLTKAQAGSDPKFYAAWFDDNAPRGVLKQALALPDLVDRICVMVPGFKDYRPWLVELLAELQAIITDSESEDTPGGGGGDTDKPA